MDRLAQSVRFSESQHILYTSGSHSGVRVPPGGTPEVFQWVRGGLAEAKVTCNGAKVLPLFVVHEGENVFMYYYQIHT